MPESAQKRPKGKYLLNSRYDEERLVADENEKLAAVRALLASEEPKGLSGLRARLDEVERVMFDRNKRRDDVAEVLGDALRQASLTDGDKIEDVLNPAIGEGIRHQLKNERPAMVAALVPMVGTLVTGAMAEAVGKLSSSINDRFEKLLSLDGMKLAIRARLSGRSINDVLIAELRKTEIKRLYIFERRTEKLTFCWPKAGEGEELSDSMAEEILKAVLSFSSGVLDSGDHGLRSIAIRDRHLVLQANNTHIVVIEVSGALSERRRGDLNDACFRILGFIADLTGNLSDVDIDQNAMGLFAARILNVGAAQQKMPTRRVTPALCLASVLGLILAGYVGWRIYDDHRIEARAEALRTHIAAGFPEDTLMLSVTAERATGTISVLGVALSEGDRAAIRDRAIEIARPYTLDFNLVNGLPDRSAPRIGAIEAKLGILQDENRLARTSLQAIDSKAEKSQARLNAVWNAKRQLADWVSSHAIFFSTGTSFRSDENTHRDLDTLAALMKNAPERPLRIIGYSDALGSEGNNRKLAFDRGELIAGELASRGVAPQRLIVLERIGDHELISPQNGTNSPNRRVEFALGFVGE